jgi:hypothetical protein
MYTISLNTLVNSGMLTLLPLTIDRAVAIMLPLHHRSIITKKSCVLMFGANWLPLLALLLYDTAAYNVGSITIEYYEKYHRCVITGRDSYIEQICLLFVPFLLVLLLYSVMLLIIFKKRRRCGWFLVTSTGIIVTSMLSYSPTVIANAWNVPLSYEASQILTVTLYYTNGIVNPIVYVVAHPATRRYLKSWRLCRGLERNTSSLMQSSVVRSGLELSKSRADLGVLEPSSPRTTDTVFLPKFD